jgi:hypothetical protein
MTEHPTLTTSIGAPLGGRTEMPIAIGGIRVPHRKLAGEIAELVRDTESPPLFHHSSRVFYWGALTGVRRGLTVDAELLYAGSMFHGMGLTYRHSSPNERLKVDCANAARDFLRGHGISQQDINTVWTAIALHTTPAIPQHMHPVIALVTAGVEMDVLALPIPNFPTRSASRWCRRSRAAIASRKTSSRLSTTASGTSRTLPSVTSRPTCSPTRTRISRLLISAA